ncbi:MAG: VCBS repeat-containing protein [Planctomycetales bacterium]|nr:VCBS repeat-containing protein [Planctomycetales bacterium]
MKSAVVFIVLALGQLVVTQSVFAQADDPGQDGWQTEAFSNIASRELSKLGDSLMRDEPNTIASTFFLADGFQGSLPENVTSHRIVAPFVFVKSSDQATSFNDPVPFVGRHRTTWNDVRDLAFHFKIVSVVATRSNVVTDVLVEATGTLIQGSKNSRWESHSKWQVTWVPAENGRARIAELVVRSEQQTLFDESSQREPTTLFRDETQSVAGQVRSFQEQLRFGQPYWLRRIETFHGMLNPGQNGISIGDLNGDSLDDIYVCQPGGLPNRLYLHQADGTLVDASREAGVDFLDNSHSSLIIDLDNDGDQDLVVATAYALLFFENQNSQFTVRYANRDMSDAYSLAATDFDLDGDLDIFACGYFPNGADVHALPIPVPYFNAKNGGANRLLRNDGSFVFTDITTDTGLGDDNRRFSYAAMWIDLENDGDDDLYIANDFGPDQVYRNDRSTSGCRFENDSDSVGLQQGAFGMSAAASDINRDGFDDVYVANMFSSAGNRVTRQPKFGRSTSRSTREMFRRLATGNSLLLNREGKRLQDVGSQSETEMGRWSWGANFVDVNNDGWDDLLVTNGYITGESTNDL